MEILYFRNQQIGDRLLWPEAGDMALTPVARREGLWQKQAGLYAEGANLLHRERFAVTLLRNTHWDLTDALRAIQALASLRGDVEVRENAAVIRTYAGWYLAASQTGPVLKGGSFLPRLTLDFEGETSPY